MVLKEKLNEKVELHPKIKERLPKYIQEKLDKGITPNDLIFHTAGLGDFSVVLDDMERKPTLGKDVSLYKLMGTDLLEQQLNFKDPEANMAAEQGQPVYSNTGYFMLGLAIETAINNGKEPDDPSWKSYYQYVKENIVEAAGMIHTSERSGEHSAVNTVQKDPHPCTPAGCWYSTAEDIYLMMKWVKEKYDEDVDFKKQIDEYTQKHYVFGGKDCHFFQHAGKQAGAGADAVLDLETGSTICFVSNSDSAAETFYFSLAHGGFDHVLKNKNLTEIYTDIERQVSKADAAQAEGPDI